MLVEDIIVNTRELIRDQGLGPGAVLSGGRLNKLLYNWNQDPRLGPTIGTLREIAASLGCSPAYLMREIIPWCPVPEENRREPISLLENNGSGIHEAYLIWQEHGGRLNPAFAKAMDKWDFWARSQLYLYEDGLFIYSSLGHRQIDYLGTWALEAPGNIVGERDPDQDYAEWTMEIWRPVVDEQKPLRYACLVANGYLEERRGLGYDGIYLPMVMHDKLYVLMVAQVMEGLLDVQN